MSGKSGLQKATIPLESLPPIKVIDSSRIGYYTRYRIVSEDRNKTSHWSPVYLLTVPYKFRRPGNSPLELDNFLVEKVSSGIVDIAWEPVEVWNGNNFIRKAISYDIWLRWSKNGSNGDWLYQERASNTSLVVLVPETYSIGGVVENDVPNQLEVEIYLRSQDILRDADHQQLLVYKSGSRENV
jgi:hypothetical protein